MVEGTGSEPSDFKIVFSEGSHEVNIENEPLPDIPDHGSHAKSGFMAKALKNAPKDVQDHPKLLVFRVVQIICAMFLISAVAENVQVEKDGETRCYFGIDETSYSNGSLTGDTETCDYAIAVGAIAMIADLALIALTIVPWFNLPPFFRFIEMIGSGVMTTMWLVLSGLLSEEMRTTCESLPCADSDHHGYDNATYDDAEAVIIFSWLAFVLWIVSTIHCFNLWRKQSEMMAAQISTINSGLLFVGDSLRRLLVIFVSAFPIKVRSHPKHFFLRILQCIIAMIVMGSIADAVKVEWNGEDACYYGITDEKPEGDVSACNMGLAVGSMGFAITFLVVVICLTPIKYSVNYFTAEMVSSGIVVALWFATACFLSRRMRDTCTHVACAAVGGDGSAYEETAYDRAESAVLFSWVSILLWLPSVRHAYKMTQANTLVWEKPEPQGGMLDGHERSDSAAQA
eukprot:Rmarinus@m.11216